jgi:hypothetical protein
LGKRALHTVLCAAGYNLRWLLRAMVRLGLTALLLRPLFFALLAAIQRANPFHRRKRWDSRLMLRLAASDEFCRADYLSGSI